MKKRMLIGMLMAVVVLVGGQILQGIEMLNPVNISSSPNGCKFPDLAFGPDGRVHIVYEEDWLGKAGADIMYVSYDGKKWTKENLTKTDYLDKKHAAVAVGDDGTIAVVWDQNDGVENIYARIWSPTQERWLNIEKVSADWHGLKPKVAVDIDGGVHVSWFQEGPGRCVTRSKIDGSWEKVVEHSRYYPNRATQTSIAASPNGTVWMLFRIKLPDTGEYKIRYVKRKLGEDWARPKVANDGGASMSHPSITVNQNTLRAYIYYQDIDRSVLSTLVRTELNERENPRVGVNPTQLVHYPVGAWDANGNEFLAWQYGAGAAGLGIKWKWRAPGGSWSGTSVLLRSTGKPKLCNIDADKFGNVGIVWDSVTPANDKDVFFSSILPVKIRAFDPPLNLVWNFEVQLINGSAQVTYNLSWAKNPKNNENQVQGYNLYRKLVGDEDYVLLDELGKNDLTRQLVYSSDSNKYLFAVSCVSTAGIESKLIEFLPTEDD